MPSKLRQMDRVRREQVAEQVRLEFERFRTERGEPKTREIAELFAEEFDGHVLHKPDILEVLGY